MPIDLGGGGGGASFFGQTFEATASGAIADGDPVLLNADGTVSAVSATATLAQPGETMFVVGYATDTVYRYNLGTAFDVSTASYSGQSFDVGPQESFPSAIQFSSDGLKMFIMGYAGDDVNEYALTLAYDITTASYTQNFSVAGQETVPLGLAFSPDGTKMFVTGNAGDDVNEYTLSSAFNISTASYTRRYSVASQVGWATGVAFNTDGTKMFVVDDNTNSVYQYNLSSGFNLSTASYSGNSLSVNAQDTGPQDITFNSDGTKMFIVGDAGNDVNEYDLSSGFDLSTASYSGTSFSVASQDTNPTGLAFGGTLIGPNLTTAENFIGIADGAYADGTTATIQLVGSVDDAQSGLTAGETYYVQTDGSLSTTPDTPEVEAGFAISATEIVVKGAYSNIPVTVPSVPPSGIKSVQRGVFTLNNISSDTETITEVDLTKSFVTSSTNINQNSVDRGLVTTRLSNSTTVSFFRRDGIDIADIAWEVVEFE